MESMSIYKPNMILHIEDDITWSKILKRLLSRPEYSSQFGDGELIYVTSSIKEQVPDNVALDEVTRLQQGAGDGLSLVSVITAQIARAFFTYNLPAAIVSDTSFPLNGKKAVEWLQSHGYPEYPLVGLSGTAVAFLDPELRDFFITGNPRYFSKGEFDRDSLAQQVVFNVRYTRELYG